MTQAGYNDPLEAARAVPRKLAAQSRESRYFTAWPCPRSRLIGEVDKAGRLSIVSRLIKDDPTAAAGNEGGALERTGSTDAIAAPKRIASATRLLYTRAVMKDRKPGSEWPNDLEKRLPNCTRYSSNAIPLNPRRGTFAMSLLRFRRRGSPSCSENCEATRRLIYFYGNKLRSDFYPLYQHLCLDACNFRTRD